MGLMKLGDIYGVSVYYDDLQSKESIIIGRKSGVGGSFSTFLVGGTLDLEKYKIVLRRSDPVYNRMITIEEDLGII